MILDANGQPVRSPIQRLMAEAVATCERVVSESMFKRTPRLLDQYGKDILPVTLTLAGWQEVLADPEKESWAGHVYQNKLSYEPRFSTVSVKEEKPDA